MKKMIKLLLAILPIIVLVCAVNLYVDPANQFRTGSVNKKVIDSFSAGMNVTVSENYRDGLLIKDIILSSDLSADTVILGSSRGAQISSEMLGRKSLNCSVTAAALEDIAAIWQMLLDSGKADSVENVVIAIDPWFFNPNYSEYRYLDTYYSYTRAFYKDAGIALPPRNYLQSPGIISDMFSVSYFQLSIKDLNSRMTSDPLDQFTPTAQPQAMNTATLRSDNSYVYPMNYEYAEQDAVYARVSQANRTILDTFEECTALGETNDIVFRHLVESMLSNGKKVYFVLSPYNPIVWDVIQNDPVRYSFVYEVEDRINQIASANGIPVAGSYDPYACGYSYGDFMDALHINSASTANLVRDLLKSD